MTLESNVSRDWKEYQEATKNREPADLLRKALLSVAECRAALDIGCGGLRDSRLLLDEGFHEVVAMDGTSPPQDVLLNLLSDGRFTFLHQPFERFYLPKARYDLVNAQFCLPFAPPSVSRSIWAQIVATLRPDGVFCGQFFGDQDGWYGDPDLTFHTEAQARAALSELDVLHFKPRSFKSKPVLEEEIKDWHIFDIIARKP